MSHRNVFAAVIVLGCAAAGCGGAASSSQWDPQAANALRAEPETMLRELDDGNVNAMLSKMDDESVVLDLDENNRPVRYEGRAKVSAYFAGLSEAMKTQGVRFKSKVTNSECKATSSFGYCVVEFNQTVSAGGQTSGPMKLRATLVARKVGEDWRWTHWHGSFREGPPPAH